MDRKWTSDGWVATIYAQGFGGDCRYTYTWEHQHVGQPTSGAVTFEVKTRTGAMVGEVSVTSTGQTVKRGLYVRPPDHN